MSTQVAHEKHVLDNGLTVLLHEDQTSPLVTVHVAYHVGSAREDPARTGFAHLFEHMMFEGSKHVRSGEHFRRVQEAGGSLNGNTNVDRTVYFETLPASGLELGLWLEADRMGSLLDALSQETLDNQRKVVKEERRQSYENRPYGLSNEIISSHLYPAGHPYSWTTIGSMAHLEEADLDDVRAFFRRFYGPNNATIAVAGDVEPARALELVKRYFGAIPRGPEVRSQSPWPVTLPAPRRLVLEDRVRVPQLTMVWPTSQAGDEDAAALFVLGRLLSENRASILDEELTIKEELAAVVMAGELANELAGTFRVILRPHEGVTLERLEQRVLELLRELGARGVDEGQLERVRTSYRAQSLRALELASARARVLAEGHAVYGDARHHELTVAQRLAVHSDDVLRVLRRYLLDAPHLALSIVSTGKLEQALPDSEQALPDSEQVGAEEAVDSGVERMVAQPPPNGPAPAFSAPEVFHAPCDNGLRIWGSRCDTLPLSRVMLALRGGHAFEHRDQLGLASLVAALAGQGTERLDPAAFERALDELGATWQVSANEDEIVFRASVLDEHLEALFELLADAVLTPRILPPDLERVRAERLVSLRTRRDDARGRAADAWPGVIHGLDCRRGLPPYGTLESVAALGIDPAREHWARCAQPGSARMAYVGRFGPDELRARLGRLATEWKASGEALDEPDREGVLDSSRVHIIDLPGAPQSEVRVGHEGIAATHPDHFPFTVVNFLLGGCFTSRLNLNLREDKGYTYGVRSVIGGGLFGHPFTCSTAVRPEVAADAVKEILAELEGIRRGVTADELAFARDAIPRSQVLQYESGWARMDFLQQISKYAWSEHYPEERREVLEGMSATDLQEQAERHIRPEEARVLVVGDARKLAEPLEKLGLGTPVVHTE